MQQQQQRPPEVLSLLWREEDLGRGSQAVSRPLQECYEGQLPGQHQVAPASQLVQ